MNWNQARNKLSSYRNGTGYRYLDSDITSKLTI